MQSDAERAELIKRLLKSAEPTASYTWHEDTLEVKAAAMLEAAAREITRLVKERDDLRTSLEEEIKTGSQGIGFNEGLRWVLSRLTK